MSFSGSVPPLVSQSIMTVIQSTTFTQLCSEAVSHSVIYLSSSLLNMSCKEVQIIINRTLTRTQIFKTCCFKVHVQLKQAGNNNNNDDDNDGDKKEKVLYLSIY